MSTDLIKCKICGDEVHAIVRHLTESHHADSREPCTLDEYREKYPAAPLVSASVAEKIAAKRKAREAEEVGGSAKSTLESAFKLKGIPAAKTSAGKDIPVDVLPDGPFQDLVAPWDADFVPDIELYKNILLAIKKNMPVYCFGMPGVGKSSVYEQVSHATNRPMMRVQHTINTEESHIVGEKMPVRLVDERTGESYTSIEFQLGPLPEAMLNGWMYLADEYDRALPQVLSVYQAVLEGKPLMIKEAPPHLRIIKPHPDFRFVATGNTNGGGDDMGLFNGTNQQDAATFERFGLVVRVGYLDEAEEIALLRKKTGIKEAHAKQIRTFAEKVREAFPREFPLTVGPRVLINLATVGIHKGCFVKGAEMAFANRLPEGPRKVALDLARRTFIEGAA